MIRITQLKLDPNENEKSLERAIRRALHLRDGEAFSWEVLRRSIDARKKPKLYEIYTVQVQMEDARREARILRMGLKGVESCEILRYRYGSKSYASPTDPERYDSKAYASPTDPDRPVIIGTGPAGLFCGLLLARQGRRPILIERGQRASEREKGIRGFWEGGSLNPDSNVQFGEGGAGTFSDGKLNTGVKDPAGRIRFILETFVQAGADPQILYSARPHVGTDVLKRVVSALTDEICERGGEVFFETRMDQIRRLPGDGLWQVSCSKAGEPSRSGTLSFTARHLVLAIGHSARDTFSMLQDAGLVMHAKAFAVGVRIQHPQEMIDRAMYGENCPYSLPASSYRLTHRLAGGRGVYSFCMCPGGYVVNASSEEGHLAVNGMSFHDRASGVANSAIVVTVSPEEIMEEMSAAPGEGALQDALIGVAYQRRLERAAFLAGEGAIPVQRFSDFTRGGPVSHIRLPGFEPCFRGRWKMADLRRIFPARISEGIEEGILAWDRQIEGFSSADALLCAVESRTSSPVRIERGPDLQALNHPGLYPCGEGAGYAGGITSAAADGLKIAEKILG